LEPDSLNSSCHGQKLSVNEDSFNQLNSFRRLSSPFETPLRNRKRIVFNTPINNKTQINCHPRNNQTKAFVRKPAFSTSIDGFFNMFHSVYKENFNKELKKVVEIEREKYEKKILLGTRNIVQNIEVDLIFNEEAASIK